MKFDTDTLLRFEQATGYSAEYLLNRYIDFRSTYYPNIVSFYSGISASPDLDSFVQMEEIIVEMNEVTEKFIQNRENFVNYSDWNLLEFFEEIKLKMAQTENISKFLRSSIGEGKFDRFVEGKAPLKENQTLENVADIALNSTDPNNDWINVALRNRLAEEDYSLDGGKMLSIVFNINRGTTDILTVVDNPQGDRIYGKDLYKVLTYEDDDLKVLEPYDTLFQSAEILVSLKRGDNPEFPDEGVQTNLIVGADSAEN